MYNIYISFTLMGVLILIKSENRQRTNLLFLDIILNKDKSGSLYL